MTIERLNNQLQAIGLKGDHENRLRAHVLNGPDFKLQFWDNDDNELSRVSVEVKDLEPVCYNITLKSIVNIPEVTIGPINSLELDRKMEVVDWSHPIAVAALERVLSDSGPAKDARAVYYTIKQVFSLHGSGAEGEELAEQLMMKHWLDSSVRNCFPNKLDHLRNKLEKACTVPFAYNITIREAKSLLHGKPLEKIININGVPTRSNLSRTPAGELLIQALPKRVIEKDNSLLLQRSLFNP
jgi:hypothetical protein